MTDRIARGDLWEVRLARSTRTVLVVESDAAIESLTSNVVCMMVDQTGGAPNTVVTIPITDPIQGAAVATDIAALSPTRILTGTYLGGVDQHVMHRVERGLQVVLDLA